MKNKENKKNLRRISVVVTAQTLWNLRELAAMTGNRDIGRVIDKLVREKVAQLRKTEEIIFCISNPEMMGRGGNGNAANHHRC